MGGEEDGLVADPDPLLRDRLGQELQLLEIEMVMDMQDKAPEVGSRPIILPDPRTRRNICAEIFWKSYKIVAHVCNDLGGWGKGFVLAISKRWPGPEQVYRAWHKNRSGNDFAVGAIQVVQVESFIWVANMVAQRGMKTGWNRPPSRYEAVRTCLKKMAVETKALRASLHMPRIGCGLAGGKWEEIEPIILDELTSQGVEVTVYDLGCERIVEQHQALPAYLAEFRSTNSPQK